jgi:hypothetical protein
MNYFPYPIFLQFTFNQIFLNQKFLLFFLLSLFAFAFCWFLLDDIDQRLNELEENLHASIKDANLPQGIVQKIESDNINNNEQQS